MSTSQSSAATENHRTDQPPSHPSRWRSAQVGDVPTGSTNAFARNLGWFSLGLGLAQLAAPVRMARLIGLHGSANDQRTMRLLGLREIGGGIGILASVKPSAGLWARVGGDVMDLALLGMALRSDPASRPRLLAAAAAVLGVMAVDTGVSMRLLKEPSDPYEARQARPIRAVAAITIQGSIADVYRWWDGFQALPQFIQDAATVNVLDSRTSRWRVPAPTGITVEWDVEVTEQRPNELIAWRTGAGSPIAGSGQVRFRPAPGDRGTEVVFTVEFELPGGELGKTAGGALAKAFSTKLGNDLRRLKQLVELGEVVQSDDSIVPGPNPAQPPATVPPTGSASRAA